MSLPLPRDYLLHSSAIDLNNNRDNPLASYSEILNNYLGRNDKDAKAIQMCYINSQKQISGSNSNFMYKLDIPYDNPYTRVVVLYCVIPKAFYNVASPYNTFKLIENGVTVTITLTEGDYSRDTLKQHVTTQLNNNSPNGFTYAITTSPIAGPETGKFNFTVAGNGVIQPILSFTSTSLYEQLGFDADSDNSFIGNTLISTNVMYLQLERTLFIHSDLTNTYDSNILQEIYSGSVPMFYNIIFKQKLPLLYAKPFSKKFNTVFNFILTDENGSEINLNGLSWNFTLLFF